MQHETQNSNMPQHSRSLHVRHEVAAVENDTPTRSVPLMMSSSSEMAVSSLATTMSASCSEDVAQQPLRSTARHEQTTPVSVSHDRMRTHRYRLLNHARERANARTPARERESERRNE